MTDPVAKKSRGFGFVTYADPESVEECLRTRPHIVNDKEVGYIIMLIIQSGHLLYYVAF